MLYHLNSVFDSLSFLRANMSCYWAFPITSNGCLELTTALVTNDIDGKKIIEVSDV